MVGNYPPLILNHQGAMDNQLRFGQRSILEIARGNSSDYLQLRSLDGALFHNGTGNVNRLTGLDISSRVNDTGTADNVYGINIGAGHTGNSTGNIINQYGISIGMGNPDVAGTRVTENNYGLRIGN